MPIVKPTAKNIKPNALEIFTDRAEEQQLLRKLLAPEQSTSLGVTFLLTQFYGVGGVGKSTLCQRACEIAAAEFKDTVRMVATSFDDSRWKEGSAFTEVSAELCRCLAGQKIMPRLTVALLMLHGQQTGRNGETAGGLDAGWSMAFTALDKGANAANIPGLGLVVDGLKWWREHSHRQALRQRLTELGLWPEEQYGKLNILDLEKKLSSALYYDLLDWLKENPGQHVRLLLDGFERLQSSERREDSQRRLQEFVGYFAGADQGDGCDRFRMVIFGRNQLRWDEIYEDPTWRDCWNLHLLGGLAEADARDFLKKTRTWLASKGQAALAEALVKYEEKILDASDETRGGQRVFYPFYLNLAVELVERARQSGQELELGRAPTELQDRFFRYLEPREQRALMVLALSEVFDESLFDWLAKERLIEYPQHSFHSQLRRERSYLQAVEGREGEWRFHRLMEDALHARWQSAAELKREGVSLSKRMLDYHGAPLLAKPERDWADREVELWRRGVEIIVKQGAELGLFNHEDWKTLLGTRPWSVEHFRCLEQRVDFARRILKAEERLLGPEHLDVLGSINNLGVLLSDKGDYSGAEMLYRRALAGYELAVGAEHSKTLGTVSDLGKLLYSKGDYMGAEVLFRRALEGRNKSLGPTHADTLDTMKNLANAISDPEESEAMHRRVLEEGLKLLGEGHPLILASVENVGIALAKKGALAEAEVFFLRSLAAHERHLGLDHPSTLKTVSNVGELFRRQNRHKEAEILTRRALLGYEKLYGARHPETLAVAMNLAEVLVEKGDHLAANQLFSRALDGQPSFWALEGNEGVLRLCAVFRANGDLQAATDLLSKYAGKAPQCLAFVRYHLARYECLGGSTEEAKRLIAEEIAAKPDACEKALKDDDLKAIHEFIRLSPTP
jgi:tetratricopeptide (TPR) repeat protein